MYILMIACYNMFQTSVLLIIFQWLTTSFLCSCTLTLPFLVVSTSWIIFFSSRCVLAWPSFSIILLSSIISERERERERENYIFCCFYFSPMSPELSSSNSMNCSTIKLDNKKILHSFNVTFVFVQPLC